MRVIPPAALQLARLQPRDYPATNDHDMHGFFYAKRLELNIISSGIIDPLWEHVSVSRINRTPTWNEMCRIKELFWDDDETVVQFHPKKSEYVNRHPYCLHLWKMAVSFDPYILPPELYV